MSPDSAAERGGLGDRPLPALLPVLLARDVDAVERVLHGAVDREVVLALVRRLADRSGARGEDLTDGGGVAERVDEALDGLGLLRLDLRRARPRRPERGRLLLRGGQPRGQLLGGLRVLAGGGDGQERTAPVTAATGEHVRDVPALDAARVLLDGPGHPGGAEHG